MHSAAFREYLRSSGLNAAAVPVKVQLPVYVESATSARYKLFFRKQFPSFRLPAVRPRLSPPLQPDLPAATKFPDVPARFPWQSPVQLPSASAFLRYLSARFHNSDHPGCMPYPVPDFVSAAVLLPARLSESATTHFQADAWSLSLLVCLLFRSDSAETAQSVHPVPV